MVMVIMPGGKSRFADYVFDPQSGELTLASQDSDATVNRLPPQPSQLLELLIGNFPEVVSHEAIQKHLWPGVISDYENNLHFCIRQIRMALGDSAASPKFLETIPRRGYRWIVEPREFTESQESNADHEVEPTDPDKKEKVDSDLVSSPNCVAGSQPAVEKDDGVNTAGPLGPASSSTPNRNNPNRRWRPFLYLLAVIYMIVASGILIYSQFVDQDKVVLPIMAEQKFRVALMPFVTDQPEFSSIGNGEIAFRILEQLDLAKLEVIGPSTTGRFDAPSPSLSRMADELELDWIVNGKFYFENAEPVILAEIIRANDGAHIWVQRFSPADTPEHVSRTIVDAINQL